MENYELQPDGRLVAGPPLLSPQPKTKKPLYFVIAALWLVTTIGAFGVGKSHVPSLHNQIVNHLQNGCVFQFRGISTTDLGRENLELEAKEAVDFLKDQPNAKNISSSSVPATDGVRRMDPTATRLVVVSWEVCQ